MASKSKRRGRVFRASCILAALIIAGSSFAWFTSKDAVTNRLSANADYDVRIVESFAPPANWLPGNEINKDVYAVNTGNIAAFVKETITSKATITQEVRVTPDFQKDGMVPNPDFDDTQTESDTNPSTIPGKVDKTPEDIQNWLDENKLVKLTPAEVYSVEAGSYLALRPDTSTAAKKATLGRQVVAFKGSATDETPTSLDDYKAINEAIKDGDDKVIGMVTDFAPEENGLYVFRRTVTVNKADDTDSFKYATEDFTYEAYYYFNGEFYKVMLTSATGDKVRDLADDKLDSDGILSAADFVFFKEEQKVVTPTLTYDAQNHELIAKINGFAVSSSLNLETSGEAYDDALHAYEEALLKLAGKVRNYDALSDAEREALLDYINAQIATIKAQRAYDNEVKNYNSLVAQETNAEDNYNDKLDELKAQSKKLFGDSYPQWYPANDDIGSTVTDTTKGGSAQQTGWIQANTTDKIGTGTYKDYLDKKDAYDASLDSEAAFIEELLKYCNDNNIDAVNNAEDEDKDTIEKIAALMTADEIADFTYTCDQHNKFENEAKYLKALKTYQDDVRDYKALNNQVNALKRDWDAAKNAREASQKELYGNNAVTESYKPTTLPDDDDVEDNEDDFGLYGALKKAESDEADAKATYDEAKAKAEGGTYDGTEYDGAKKEYEDALANVVTTKNTLDNARMKYLQDKSDFNNAGDIIVHIGLKNDTTTGGVVDKWQLLPVYTAIDHFQNPDDTAVFYYTSILEGGETSKKLIDYVTLDKGTTQEMFKHFDFDLDVKMDSAQITKSATDDSIITTDAVDAEFTGVDVVLSDPTDINTALAWSEE